MACKEACHDYCQYNIVWCYVTQCVIGLKGTETLFFHATGAKAMDDLVYGGSIQGVLNIATEVLDYIAGGIDMVCNGSRFVAI